MSDDLERLLREVPARVPRPDERVTRRVREAVVALARPRRRPLPLAVLAATLAGIAIGYWMIPQEEPAVGAADPPAVSITAAPRLVKMGERVTVFGSIVTRRAGEQVTIEENICGRGWTANSIVTTAGNGTYNETLEGVRAMFANTLLRARWRGSRSNAVPIRVRPVLTLRQKTRRLFKVDIYTVRLLIGRPVVLERYDRGRARWRVAARTRMREQYGINVATFRVLLPKNTIVRAVLPLAQARPCHLGGYSNMLTVA